VIRGLLLDFDGTLCDSVAGLREYFHAFMSGCGAISTDEDFDRLNGRPIVDCMHDLVTRGILDGEADTLADQYLDGLERQLPAFPPMPGHTELLQEAARQEIGVVVVSSGRSPNIRDWLDRQGVAELVRDVVGSDTVSPGKPDGAPYRLAARLLDLSPQDCLAVEDSESGVTSALSASVPTVRLGTGPHPNVQVVADLGGVVRILREGATC